MAKHDQLDRKTLALVRLAAAVAQGYEPDIRDRVNGVRSADVPAIWVEELLLQSVLMVGYPRTLVAYGIWRKLGPAHGPEEDPDTDYGRAGEWKERGEVTCARIYGDNYRKLRENVRDLHPALDAWMLVEGYGRTLS
ncbi:MAG: carboxymuconolactone decarboxylase family protein, partial [Gemmatimonadales bacterium]